MGSVGAVGFAHHVLVFRSPFSWTGPGCPSRWVRYFILGNFVFSYTSSSIILQFFIFCTGSDLLQDICNLHFGGCAICILGDIGFSIFWQCTLLRLLMSYNISDYSTIIHHFWVIPLIQVVLYDGMLILSDFIVLSHFGPFSTVCHFWQIVGSVEVVHCCSWSYNISDTIIHHFWLISLIQCGFIWWNADFCVIFIVLDHFHPFSAFSDKV